MRWTFQIPESLDEPVAELIDARFIDRVSADIDETTVNLYGDLRSTKRLRDPRRQ
jgi:hypothetical protein